MQSVIIMASTFLNFFYTYKKFVEIIFRLKRKQQEDANNAEHSENSDDKMKMKQGGVSDDDNSIGNVMFRTTCNANRI